MPQKRALVLGALLLCALVAVGLVYVRRSPEQPAVTPAPKITLAARQFRLANGVDVELVSGPCGDEAAVALLYGVGVEHDPVGHSGLSAVLGRVLSAIVAPATVEVGATFTRIARRVPVAQLIAELDAVAQRMKPLTVDATAFEQARQQVLDEIARRHGGDPRSTAIAFALQSAQSARAEGHFGGIAEEVTALQIKDVTDAWQKHFQPANLRVVVVGGFDPTAIQRHLEQALGGLPAGEAAQLREHGASTVSGTVVMGDNPSALAFGLAAPGASAPTFAAFLVLARRLSAGEPTWQFDYDPLGRTGTLLLTATTPTGQRPEPVAETLRAALAKRIAEPFKPSEVAATQQHFAALLGTHDLDPAACRTDALALAVARAQRAKLGIDIPAISKALSAMNETALAQARPLFAAERTVIVAAGGEIR
ncbi:MAG TPA: insulinase family protein [Polyangiaceae bacterium]|nr:insulinase family protein [Polyangiaceae bacterium]